MLAIVAPGQGAQTPGFLKPWLSESTTFASRLTWLSAVSGIDLAHYGTEADAETIRDTAIAQPLLVAAGLLAALELFPHPADAFPSIGVAAGHSVGEITAAAGVGVLSAEQAMVFVRERGLAMAAASAVRPTSMTAVIGGQPEEVLAALEEHGLTAANHNGSGQIVAAGTTEQLAALAAAPPARARLIELSVAGAFHTVHMEPAVARLGTLARAISTHDPRTRLLSNADGQVVHDGREVLRRLVGQVASPVRWDLCMAAMADLGVTGLLEMPPAGTLTGIAKRNLKGVELFALNTPDQIEDALAFVQQARRGHLRLADHRQPDLAAGGLAGQGPVHPDRGHRDRHGAAEPQHRRHGEEPAGRDPGERAARRDRRRVAGGERRPGRPGPAAAPAAPDRRDRRRHRSDPMTRSLKISQGAQYAAILGFGGYRPRRVVDNAEIVTMIDSSDEWIRTRSGIIERRWAEPDETVQMMSVSAARRALERAGVEPAQIDTVIVSTVTHLHQTPAVATTIATELGANGAAAFDISAACAGFCYATAMADSFIRSGASKYVLIIGVERLSDMTNKADRSTAFIFADGAGAAIVGPSDTQRIGPVVWGSDGEQAPLIGQTEPWDTGAARRGPVGLADAADGGEPGLQVGLLHHGQDRRRGARCGRRTRPRTSRCSRRTRPTCGSPTRCSALSSCPEMSWSPATSPARATPPPPPSRWPSRPCWSPARPSRATPA